MILEARRRCSGCGDLGRRVVEIIDDGKTGLLVLPKTPTPWPRPFCVFWRIKISRQLVTSALKRSRPVYAYMAENNQGLSGAFGAM